MKAQIIKMIAKFGFKPDDLIDLLDGAGINETIAEFIKQVDAYNNINNVNNIITIGYIDEDGQFKFRFCTINYDKVTQKLIIDKSLKVMIDNVEYESISISYLLKFLVLKAFDAAKDNKSSKKLKP